MRKFHGSYEVCRSTIDRGVDSLLERIEALTMVNVEDCTKARNVDLVTEMAIQLDTVISASCDTTI